MSDDRQSEELRPIPDGGLKDAMPGWLKRPPAWRSMPSAEQRHERTLPEPDTSEIDPKTLVDVSDLPKWLQTIAARGEVPIPEPDQAVGHALLQIQAASARTLEPDPEPEEPIGEEALADTTREEPVETGTPQAEETESISPAVVEDETDTQPTAGEASDRSEVFTPLVMGVLAAAIVILLVAAYFLI